MFIFVGIIFQISRFKLYSIFITGKNFTEQTQQHCWWYQHKNFELGHCRETFTKVANRFNAAQVVFSQKPEVSENTSFQNISMLASEAPTMKFLFK